MPSDESKGSQLDAIGSLAQHQLDNTAIVVQAQNGRGAHEEDRTTESGLAALEPTQCMAR